MNGIVLIDKDKYYTSRDIVNAISKKYNTKKVGHTGTLDPRATGVLAICVGSATKLVDILSATDKEYIAEFTFGILTETLDLEKEIIKREKTHIETKEILEALKSLEKTYMQEVPLYSAVKVNGKKLYEYARNKEEVILPKKEVTIYSLKLLNIKYENDTTIITVKCHVSKGTYIRSIVSDLAKKLNTIGVMTNLRRTRQGNFKLESCKKINEEYNIIPIREILTDYYVVEVNDLELHNVLHGNVMDNIYGHEKILFMHNNIELATYTSYNRNKIKPEKMFKVSE